jgi:hypothetical protein
MAEWRFLAYDMVSSAFIAELAPVQWQHTDALNDAGSWSAQIEATAQTWSLIRDYTGRLIIVAERGGIPQFTGVLWKARADVQARTITLAGAGLLSFYDHFAIIATLGPYTGVDQFTIFRNLHNALIAQSTNSNIGINLEATLSGVLRDRTYEAYSGKTFGQLMRELAAVDNGFDFAVRVEYVSGAAQRWLRTWYPRRGRTVENAGLRFTDGGNASITSIDLDATDMATTVVASGASVTTTLGDIVWSNTLRTTASRTDLVAAGFPGYLLTKSWDDITVLGTLDQSAIAEVTRLSNVDRESYTFDVDPDSVGHPYGSWELGDDALLIVNDLVFGTITAQRRVIAHNWQVAASGELLSVTVQPKSAAPTVGISRTLPGSGGSGSSVVGAITSPASGGTAALRVAALRL